MTLLRGYATMDAVRRHLVVGLLRVFSLPLLLLRPKSVPLP
jgi:hypothetical protein